MMNIKKLIEKIKYYFLKIFKQDKLLLREGNDVEQQDNVIIKNDTNFNMVEKADDEYNLASFIIESDKKEFFELYNNVKNKNVNLENIMLYDLLKIEMFMEEEIKIYDEKINVKANKF